MEDLLFYNDFFEKVQDTKKLKKFEYNSKGKKFEGEILLSCKKKDLTFKVEIPETYPIGELKFITKDFQGYPHQNFDGSLCLNTSFVNHLYTRLNLEFEKLKGYVSQYFEGDFEDSHYEYSAFVAKDLITMIFQEDNHEPDRFSTPFGLFKYSILNFKRDQQNRIDHLTIFAQSLGHKDYYWSKSYKEQEKYTGAWVFIEKEPIYQKKHRITNWEDLANLLPMGFSDFFRNLSRSSANYKLYPKGLEENIFLAIGYKIPNGKDFEVHWDLALLPRYDFPRKSHQANSLLRYSKPIQWDSTYNSSYKRFFGRGALDEKLSSQKILIIGNGAIGSSFAETLARSGAKKIDLADIDHIELGNICRSSYGFKEISLSKSDLLKAKLENTSPFIEVDVITEFKATSSKSSDFTEVFRRLQSYDIIFDFTGNNEIIQMLSDLKLESRVFYISMSNKAKEMVCVTNADNSNLIERRNQMLYSFGTFKEPEFREGTGCWHPTFEASYFDINQLLHFTIRKINSFYSKNEDPKTFYTFFDEEGIGYSQDIKFFQSDLNLNLTVESSVLETIESLARAHFPNEFGGILLGSYLNNYTDLVISDVICPENFRNGPTRFEPNHKELNQRLKEYYNHFSNKVVYVGDWHSHPNSTNHFSQTDFNSVKEVANSNKVNIKNPILLIAAYGEDYFDPGFYVYNKNKLYKFKLK